MDDHYPSTDEQQAVHLDFPYPDAEHDLSRMILFTGRYPPAVFEYIEGVIRWHNRVGAYAFLLITDRYPPFSLQP
ncbi:MAG: DUF4389 domain-containing protein [Solirubrobacteraceae bacterium]